MSEFETEVKSNLHDMNDKLDILLQWKAGLEEICMRHRKDTIEIQQTLYGERNGIVKTINNLVNCKRNTKEWRIFWMYVLRVVVAAIILGAAGWFLSAYKYFA